MRPIKVSLVFLIVILAVACQKDRRLYVQQEEDGHSDIPGNIIPDILNIKISEDLADQIVHGADPRDFFEDPGIVSISRLFPYDSLFEDRQRAAGLHRWYTIKYNGTTSTTKAAQLLKSTDGVEIVEQLPIAEPASVNVPFNDPSAKLYQWHLINDGSLRSGFKNGADINVVPVWNKFTAGNSNVIVAVIDSGVQWDHPDLNGVVLPPGENGSKSFYTKNTLTPYDYTPADHATHVAGIIGAINNNGIGVCGIAGGNDGTGGVRILDCQAIGESAYTSSAVVWATNHGAVIANNSWSLVYDSEDAVPLNTLSSYVDAINYFIDNAGLDSQGNQTGPMRGGVAFFSAGNKGWSRSQPAMYERVIAVGATGPAFDKASYSNYGDWVDICAPGGNSTPFNNDIAKIYSTKAGGTYGFSQGTSMSCPVVTGVAALLVSHFGGPGFTNEDLKELLLGGAKYDLVSGNIGPFIDAYESFTVKDKHCLPVDDLQTVAGKYDVSIVWTVKAYGDAPAFSYLTAISQDRSQLVNLDPFNIPSGVTSKRVYTYDGKIGGRTMANFTKLEPGTYYATAIGVEQNHRYVGGNAIAKFTLYGNRKPVITGVPSEPLTVLQDDSFTFDMDYSDPDGDEVTVSVERASAADVWKRPAKGKLQLIITGGKADDGAYTTKATLTDSDGAATLVEVHYTINNNKPPVISVTGNGKTPLTHNETTCFTLSYSDEDGDVLSVTDDPGSAAGKWEDDGAGTLILTITGKDAPAGSYTATASVSDGIYSDEVSIPYTILPNIDPVITHEGSVPGPLKYRDNASLTIRCSDADGDVLTAVTDPGSKAAVWTDNGDGSYTLSIRGDSAPAGTYTASISISDGFGGSAGKEIEYTLKGNKAPTLASPFLDIIIDTGESEIIDLSKHFTDPDGDALVFRMNSTGDVFAELNGSFLAFSLSKSGAGRISVSADDGIADPVEASFRVSAFSKGAVIADLYPTTVTDRLTVHGVSAGNAKVQIYTSTGRSVYSRDLTLNPYNPTEIDLSGLAPGRYTVIVSKSGSKIKQTIVKI